MNLARNPLVTYDRLLANNYPAGVSTIVRGLHQGYIAKRVLLINLISLVMRYYPWATAPLYITDVQPVDCT